MPYIKQEFRPLLDVCKRLPDDAGELNYVITTILDQYIKMKGKKYQTLNEVIGVMECAKLELYRRVAAPYEDTKIIENGDVYT